MGVELTFGVPPSAKQLRQSALAAVGRHDPAPAGRHVSSHRQLNLSLKNPRT